MNFENWSIYQDNVIPTGAIFIGIISLIMSYYLNSRTLKHSEILNKKSLRQSEINITRELRYEDEKKAMKILMELVDNDLKYLDKRNDILVFLKSFEGSFLPVSIAKSVIEDYNKLDEFERENDPSYPSDEYFKDMEENYSEYLEEKERYMHPYDKYSEELSRKINESHNSIKHKIIKKIKDSYQSI